MLSHLFARVAGYAAFVVGALNPGSAEHQTVQAVIVAGGALLAAVGHLAASYERAHGAAPPPR